MNRFVFLSLFLLLFFSVKAQDKIISSKHDTILCTIVTINNERIFYELKNKDGSVTGKSMPLSQVAEYLASQRTGQKSSMNMQQTPKSDYAIENRILFGLSAGYSTMPWYLDYLKSSSALPDYYNKLKTGMHINASAHYLVNDALGVGIEYSFFKTSASGSTPVKTYSSIFLMGSEKYRQYVNYLGASVLFKQPLDEQRKFILSESISAGVMLLHMEYQSMFPSASQSKYSDISNNTLLTGNTLGGKFGLMAEYRLLKSVSVGLGGSFIWGSLKKVNYKSKGSDNYSDSGNDQELSNAMKLSRIDCSFALHYYF